jgi:hypothetical protein
MKLESEEEKVGYRESLLIPPVGVYIVKMLTNKEKISLKNNKR